MIFDAFAMFAIRPYHASDLPLLYRICLQTGDSGKDATGQVDEQILGHIFAAPYVHHEPELAFTLLLEGTPVGYVLGTSDSSAFANWCEETWWPALREQYGRPGPADRSRQAQLVRALHRGYQPPFGWEDYPAHLHVDILPVAQGQGYGPRLIDAFTRALVEREVGGVHLGVGKQNRRALEFYPGLGFTRLEDTEHGILFGKRL